VRRYHSLMREKTSVVYVEVPRSLRKRLDREAKSSGRTLTAVVQAALMCDLYEPRTNREQAQRRLDDGEEQL